jgi:hypothetical protein
MDFTKTWKKVLLAVIFVIAFVFSLIYALLAFRGKEIIAKTITGITHKSVTIGSFSLTPPLNIQIKKLDIEGSAKVEEIFITPSIPCLLTGRIALNSVSIIKPQILYERNNPQSIKSQAKSSPQATQTPQGKNTLNLIIKRLIIKNGVINLVDNTIGKESLKINIKDLNFRLTNLYLFPFSAIANFDLKGRIPWKEGKEEGKISLDGWINLFKKDMQASLKIADIDAIYLYPYYSTWVDLEKARIESASLNFSSDIKGLDNNVTADCRLELTDIVRKPRAADEPQEKAERITDVVLEIFKSLNQGNIVLDFTIKTKMDNPEFGFGNIKAAFEDKLARSRGGSGIKAKDVLMLPSKLIESTIKGATDISKAVVDGTFAVGNEIKKSVENSFKKETPTPSKDTQETDKKN